MKKTALKWLNRPHPVLMILSVLVVSCSAFASDIPKELVKIHREANHYYRIDGKAVTLVESGGDYVPEKMFGILKFNSPASCSHTAALKAKWIAERTDYKPFIVVYQMKSGFYHAVTVVMHEGGWWWMDNDTNWIESYASLFGLQDMRAATLEQWQELYGVK